jgi:hypothetical protein
LCDGEINPYKINIDPIQKELTEPRDIVICTLRDKRVVKEKKYGPIINQA